MQLVELRVIHWKKGQAGALPTGALLSGAYPGAFSMDSCLRRVWICTSSGLQNQEVPCGAEVFSGKSAYAFLLSVACGLESKVLGETDVFGQFKQAWKVFEQTETSNGDLRAQLSVWIPRIFEDTKDIRAQFLQNLGGSSYGSLLRKLMREQTGGSGEPVLLVGAGQLAFSVAPYLSEFEILLTNRTAERLGLLHQELLSQPGARVSVVSSERDVTRAWQSAAQTVVCVPYDPEQDAVRIEAWKEGGGSRPLYHLGEMNSGSEAWRVLPGFHSLEDLFQLEKSQGQVRSAQLALARRACEVKSKLRALGGSLSLAHGWEDLALFA